MIHLFGSDTIGNYDVVWEIVVGVFFFLVFVGGIIGLVFLILWLLKKGRGGGYTTYDQQLRPTYHHSPSISQSGRLAGAVEEARNMRLQEEAEMVAAAHMAFDKNYTGLVPVIVGSTRLQLKKGGLVEVKNAYAHSRTEYHQYLIFSDPDYPKTGRSYVFRINRNLLHGEIERLVVPSYDEVISSVLDHFEGRLNYPGYRVTYF
jgi:hypothetical protein